MTLKTIVKTFGQPRMTLSPPAAVQYQALEGIRALLHFIKERPGLVALTGAGISTESGIPDYRSPGGAYSLGHKPIQHQAFVRSEAARQRYWGRAYLGYAPVRDASPNGGHTALAALQRGGWVSHIITQNVDALHQRAGCEEVVELHGTMHEVVCLDCGDVTSREELQRGIALLNPTLDDHLADHYGENLGTTAEQARPDGDVAVEYNWSEVVVPPCKHCGGRLKPHVVMFGDSVPIERREYCKKIVAESSGLLVLGTTLQTYSAYQYAVHAREHNIPVVIVNDGPTRGDDLAAFKVEARLGEVLQGVAKEVDDSVHILGEDF